MKSPRSGSGSSALDVVEPSPARPNDGWTVGRLVGLAGDGEIPLVVFPGQVGNAAIEARTTVDLHSEHVGCEVVLAFEADQLNRPIVMGRVRGAGDRARQRRAPALEIEVDEQRMIVTATNQLVLRCGKASITLTSAGKVLIAGTYVLSHSSGVNRVRGGSVQLN